MPPTAAASLAKAGTPGSFTSKAVATRRRTANPALIGQENVPPSTQKAGSIGRKRPSDAMNAACSALPKEEPLGCALTAAPANASREHVWREGRAAFHRSAPFPVVGRSAERAVLEKALAKGGLAVYVCGNPGTGKTALVHELVDGLDGFEAVKVNCAMQSLVDALGIFLPPSAEGLDRIDFEGGKREGGKREGGKRVVLVLDEIDHLPIHERERVLQWPSSIPACHAVIGIANTVTAAHSSQSAEVKVVLFEQYSVDDIVAILQARDIHRLFTPPALEVAARKVAATGDLRRAFELMQAAIDVYGLKEGQVELPHVLQACDRLLHQSTIAAEIAPLTVHQKLALLILSNPSTTTMQTLYEQYAAAIRSAIKAKLPLDCLSKPAFVESMEALQCSSLISLEAVSKRGRPSLHTAANSNARGFSSGSSVSLRRNPAETQSALLASTSLMRALHGILADLSVQQQQ